VSPLGHTKFHANRFTGVGTLPLKFPLFGEESLRRGESFHRFLQLLEAIIRSTILN